MTTSGSTASCAPCGNASASRFSPAAVNCPVSSPGTVAERIHLVGNALRGVPIGRAERHGGRSLQTGRVAMSLNNHDLSAKSGWFPDLLMRLALASGIGYLAAAYTVSRWLTRRNPGRPPAVPA